MNPNLAISWPRSPTLYILYLQILDALNVHHFFDTQKNQQGFFPRNALLVLVYPVIGQAPQLWPEIPVIGQLQPIYGMIAPV